ncbi:hypothetical protein EYF80_034745 [Liparis tanakae]|uniref:Uncharacterized protein n=1 Tax=Liparis tanakae TaxID=230148 RepID=A0A4Z2GNW3_9TELE|nr:hypothetical protein EYF80_034745 [Liparis tanakae]
MLFVCCHGIPVCSFFSSSRAVGGIIPSGAALSNTQPASAAKQGENPPGEDVARTQSEPPTGDR